jgi:hypothetical protein
MMLLHFLEVDDTFYSLMVLCAKARYAQSSSNYHSQQAMLETRKAFSS